jgi:hypothetical protein
LHDVLPLLETVGSVDERGHGNYVVTIGAERQTFDHVGQKDVDTEQLAELRRMLGGGGYTVDGAGMTPQAEFDRARTMPSWWRDLTSSLL